MSTYKQRDRDIAVSEYKTKLVTLTVLATLTAGLLIVALLMASDWSVYPCLLALMTGMAMINSWLSENGRSKLSTLRRNYIRTRY